MKSLQMKKYLRRCGFLAGGIVVVSVLAFFAGWLVFGDQLYALKLAAILLCVLVAFAAVGVTIVELARE